MPTFSVNECRGSDETVSGMPVPEPSASSWAVLYQRTTSSAVLTGPAMLTWRMCRSSIMSRSPGRVMPSPPSKRVPPGPIMVMEWNSIPAFSGRLILARICSARSASV